MCLLTLYAHWRVQNDTCQPHLPPPAPRYLCWWEALIRCPQLLHRSDLQWEGAENGKVHGWQTSTAKSRKVTGDARLLAAVCRNGGRNMHWRESESPALFRQDGLRRPKVHANTNLESHTCSGSQSWENKSPFQCWLYTALIYGTPQLPRGQKRLSWPLFSTLVKLRALQIKLKVKQNPGHNFLPWWSCLFSLENLSLLYLPTCLFSSISWKMYLSCLGACWVNCYGYFSDLNTGAGASPPLFSSLGMLIEEKGRLLLLSRDAQAAVKPLLTTAFNIICESLTQSIMKFVHLKMLEMNVPEINIKQ